MRMKNCPFKHVMCLFPVCVQDDPLCQDKFPTLANLILAPVLTDITSKEIRQTLLSKWEVFTAMNIEELEKFDIIQFVKDWCLEEGGPLGKGLRTFKIERDVSQTTVLCSECGLTLIQPNPTCLSHE